jgi:hypothetical protein
MVTKRQRAANREYGTNKTDVQHLVVEYFIYFRKRGLAIFKCNFSVEE